MLLIIKDVQVEGDTSQMFKKMDVSQMEYFNGLDGHYIFVYFSLITITHVPLSKTLLSQLLQWSYSVAGRSDCAVGPLPGVNVPNCVGVPLQNENLTE